MLGSCWLNCWRTFLTAWRSKGVPQQVKTNSIGLASTREPTRTKAVIRVRRIMYVIGEMGC